MKKSIISSVVVLAAMQTVSFNALAEESKTSEEDKKYYFRLGLSSIQPDSSSTEVSLVVSPELHAINEGLESANLPPAVEEGAIENSGISVGSATLPTLTLGYVLPIASGQWAVETVLAMPYKVDLNHEGSLKNESQFGLPAFGEKLGDTKVLSPAVTLVYKFMNDKPLRPYAGAGITYLKTYDSKVTNNVINTYLGDPKLEIDDVFGYVLQTGVEFNFRDDWWVTADIKYAGGLDADAEVSDLTLPEGLPTVGGLPLGSNEVTVTVDPWVYSLGLGYAF